VVHAKHAGQSSAEPEDNTVYPECIEAARGIPVIANGGIDTVEKVRSLMEMGVSGVMMGRPAMGNPAIFDLMKNELGLNDPLKPISLVSDLRDEYIRIFDSIEGTEKYRTRFLKVLGREKAHY
jgi:tRNA-dihydrouridine synthase